MELENDILEEEANEREIRRIRQARLAAKKSHQMSEHQVNQSGNCVIEGCPCRGWSAAESAKGDFRQSHTAKYPAKVLAELTAAGELNNEQYQRLRRETVDSEPPAARGGGDEGELRPGMSPTCLRCFNDGWDAHQRGLHPANFEAGFATKDAKHTCNQHHSLMAERERLERMLAAVINAHYGLAYRSIGSGDGIAEKEATEIGRWWLDYTASDARDVNTPSNDQKRGVR